MGSFAFLPCDSYCWKPGPQPVSQSNELYIHIYVYTHSLSSVPLGNPSTTKILIFLLGNNPQIPDVAFSILLSQFSCIAIASLPLGVLLVTEALLCSSSYLSCSLFYPSVSLLSCFSNVCLLFLLSLSCCLFRFPLGYDFFKIISLSSLKR